MRIRDLWGQMGLTIGVCNVSWLHSAKAAGIALPSHLDAIRAMAASGE
jgi:hypothetical protein